MSAPASHAVPDKPSALLSVLSGGVPGGSASGLLGRLLLLDIEYSHSAAKTSASPEPPIVAATPTSVSHSVDQNPGRSCATHSTSNIRDYNCSCNEYVHNKAVTAKMCTDFRLGLDA